MNMENNIKENYYCGKVNNCYNERKEKKFKTVTKKFLVLKSQKIIS